MFKNKNATNTFDTKMKVGPKRKRKYSNIRKGSKGSKGHKNIVVMRNKCPTRLQSQNHGIFRCSSAIYKYQYSILLPTTQPNPILNRETDRYKESFLTEIYIKKRERDGVSRASWGSCCLLGSTLPLLALDINIFLVGFP